MSTAEILSLISTISFIIAVLSFLVAIFLWFFFKMPSVIGDLSGRTARKSIARIRANNERVGGQGYRPSAVNENRGRITDTMHGIAKPHPPAPKKQPPQDDQRPETGLLRGNLAEAAPSEQTALLHNDEATGMLLDADATAPLNESKSYAVKHLGGVKLTMLDEVILTHTDEVIP